MAEKNRDSLIGFNGNQEELRSKLNQLFQDLLKGKAVQQATAAVESGDGSFRWFAAENKAGPAEAIISPGTPFWIASVTKLFIAAAILKLQEKKLLLIDHPAEKYLPQGLINGLHRTKDGVDYSSQLTIKHLLSHTSGLPDYLEIKPKGGKSLFDIALEEGDRAWTVWDFMQIVREAKKPLFAPQPFDQPVQKARYSDTNYQLLIAIIEEVTGKPLDSVFKEMFFKPLGMQRTFHPGASPLDPDTPQALPVWGGDKLLDMPLAMKSFGDLYSTTGDLLTFIRSLNSGIIFDNTRTAELMKSNWNRFGFLRSPVAPGWPIEYGLGMMRLEMPRAITPIKPVPAVIGHTGACGSWLFYCPAYDLYITGTVNQLLAAPAPFRFVPKVLNLMGSYLGT